MKKIQRENNLPKISIFDKRRLNTLNSTNIPLGHIQRKVGRPQIRINQHKG
jgi:hypothetical protein